MHYQALVGRNQRWNFIKNKCILKLPDYKFHTIARRYVNAHIRPRVTDSAVPLKQRCTETIATNSYREPKAISKESTLNDSVVSNWYFYFQTMNTLLNLKIIWVILTWGRKFQDLLYVQIHMKWKQKIEFLLKHQWRKTTF